MTAPEVVYLHPHFTIEGGAGRIVLETSARLARQGVQVSVVSIRAEEAIVGACRGVVRFVDLGGPLSSQLGFWLRFPRVQGQIRRLLDARPAAVVFAQVFPANWWGALYKLVRPQRRVVWMCQEPSAFIHSQAGLDALPPSPVKLGGILLGPLLRRLDVALMRRTDRVLANSEATRRRAQEVYRLGEDRLFTVRLGVDLARFAPASAPRAPRFVSVGRLTRFKNVDVVVRAVAELRRRGHADVSLHVVGRGEDEARLAALVRELGLLGQVVLRGALGADELVRTLQAARGLVLASVDEPFGLVAVEAMACGTPAVVTGSGGPAEVVEHDRSGLVLPAGLPLPEAVAEAMEFLLVDETFARLSAGAALRARAFSIDHTTALVRAHLFEEPLPPGASA